MKKYLIPTLVVAMLLIFPAVSWYYLKTGLKWRRDAMGELSDYGNISAFEIPLEKARNIDLKELEDNLLIFYRVNCGDTENETKILGQILTQFEKRPDVRIYALGNCLEEIEDFRSVNNVLRKINCSAEPAACNAIERSIFEKAGNSNIAFVDGNLNIRNFYHSDVEAENKRLIEHMAMMLPDERRKYGKENQTD